MITKNIDFFIVLFIKRRRRLLLTNVLTAGCRSTGRDSIEGDYRTGMQNNTCVCCQGFIER
jgi:hypothetical protein